MGYYTTTHPKPRDFLDLQAHWYKKLEESGFKDIENLNKIYGNAKYSHLTRSSSDFSRKFNQLTYDYYANCRHYVACGTFPNKIDKKILKWHANAVSLRDISLKLKDYGVRKSYYWVFEQLVRIRHDMYIWLKEEEAAAKAEEIAASSKGNPDN